MTPQELLSNVPLFESLTDDDVNALAARVEFVNSSPSAALRIIGEMSERLRQTNELMSRQVSRNVLLEAEERLTFGQRVADRVAKFGGSWPFIFLFGGV